MRAPQMDRISSHFRRLKLSKAEERVEALLQEATEKELTYSDFLDRLLSEEVAAKTDKAIQMRTKMARLPYLKSLESFDFKYQPSIDEKQIRELATCRFIEHGDSIVFLHAVKEGPANQSYGLQVAALAGVPPTVITQARKKLVALEDKAYRDQQQKAGNIQMDLFASGEFHPAISLLETIEPDATTPREALNLLYTLKSLLT